MGGDFRGDFDLDRNMLSVVAARVIDRAWNGRGIWNDLDDRASGEDLTGDVGEKAEGDIGGLTPLAIGAFSLLSDVDAGGSIGLGSERSSGTCLGSIVGADISRMISKRELQVCTSVRGEIRLLRKSSEKATNFQSHTFLLRPSYPSLSEEIDTSNSAKGARCEIILSWVR